MSNFTNSFFHKAAMVWLPWPRVLSTGGATVRRAEDVDSAALTYAEVKAIASGNPLVIEKATIDAEVMRLTRLKKQHAESFYQMRYRIRGRNDNAAVLGREIANIREDLCTRISTRGDNFATRVKNETFTDRIKAGRAIIFLAAALKPFESTKTIRHYRRLRDLNREIRRSRNHSHQRQK